MKTKKETDEYTSEKKMYCCEGNNQRKFTEPKKYFYIFFKLYFLIKHQFFPILAVTVVIIMM